MLITPLCTPVKRNCGLFFLPFFSKWKIGTVVCTLFAHTKIASCRTEETSLGSLDDLLRKIAYPSELLPVQTQVDYYYKITKQGVSIVAQWVKPLIMIPACQSAGLSPQSSTFDPPSC